ncbi:MAG: 2-C-methyl-D-erythritol 4-phosphate cytidylyltransferase [Evtepia sp.]
MKIFGRKQQETAFCSMILLAAGNASRMEGKDKIFLELRDVPVLAYSLKIFEASPKVHEIIIVTRSEMMTTAADICRKYDIHKAVKIVVGGRTRVHSVMAGLCEVSPNAQLIAIHDAARPFLTQTLLENVIARATDCGAAAPAIPVKDTIKVSHEGIVEKTPDRTHLFAVQTPQIFRADIIKNAMIRALKENAVVTDDCSAVERLGIPVTLTQGEEENIKVTTPMDLIIGEVILMGRDYV